MCCPVKDKVIIHLKTPKENMIVTLSPSLLDPRCPEESENGKLLKKLGENEWRKACRMFLMGSAP